MKHAIPVVAMAALLASCATAPASPTGDGWAGIGGVARVGPLLIQPVEVLEDSRCPIIAQCVWAGRVVLVATIRGVGNQPMRTELKTGEPLMIADGMLDLDEITPARTSGAAASKSDYRFHFTYRAN